MNKKFVKYTLSAIAPFKNENRRRNKK